jgi:death on curing protein
MIKSISKQKIIELHNRILTETGGEPGILFEASLEFIDELLPSYSKTNEDVHTYAALICHQIITGHPFVDGNKRTGYESTDVFLRGNGYKIQSTPTEGLEFTLSIARSELDRKGIYHWLKKHTESIK